MPLPAKAQVPEQAVRLKASAQAVDPLDGVIGVEFEVNQQRKLLYRNGSKHHLPRRREVRQDVKYKKVVCYLLDLKDVLATFAPSR